MCGLFGWVGDNPKNFNRHKFNVLGIQNETRGTHSCGVAVDGETYKGAYATSEFRKFIASEDSYPDPKEIPVVIGHTRKATGGAHTKENAHPFIINLDEGYVIGAHNGMIRNEDDLAKKYGITDTRDKIDSQILLEIIAQGNLEVLSEYTGAAALLIYSSIAPDTLWVYKGASQEFQSSKVLKEERPMFFYVEEKNKSVYFSSIADSLRGIVDPGQNTKDVIFATEPNRLYEFKAGKIVNKYIVDRTSIWNKNSTNTQGGHSCSLPAVVDDEDDCGSKNTSEQNCRVNSRNEEKDRTEYSDRSSTSGEQDKDFNIFYEKTIQSGLIQQDIIFENLRYKRNGQLVTGACIFVEEIGFVRIADKDNIHKLSELLKNFEYYEDLIQQKMNFGDCSDATIYYMFKGVLCKTAQDYHAMTKGAFANTELDLGALSHASCYPIIDLSRIKKGKIVTKNTQNAIYENNFFTGVIEPVGSSARYKFKQGDLMEKEELDDITQPSKEAKVLSLYEDGLNSIIENEENGSFDEDIAEELSVEDMDEIDTLIECAFDMQESLEVCNQIHQYKNDGTAISKMFSEFIESTEISFAPIKEHVNHLLTIKEESK